MTKANKNKKFNQPEAPNARAARVMQSWFNACGVYAEPHPSPGYGLVVRSADGALANIAVTPAASITTEPGALNIIASGDALLNVARDVALGEFTAVAKKLGYVGLNPVERGERPDHRLTVEDDFDLIVMRHMEFRNAPNPDPVLFERYEKSIVNPSIYFFRHNVFLCDLFGLTVQDLTTYAQVWAVNFFHKYQRTDRDTVQNAKLLNAHIMQRFGNFHSALTRKAKSVLPDQDTASLGCHGTMTVSLRQGESEGTSTFFREDGLLDVACEHEMFVPEIEAEEDSNRRKPEIDTSSIRKRRASAAALLAKKLSEMPHDAMIAALKDVAENERCCPDARDEANKWLKGHEAACSTCNGTGNGLM